MNRKKWVERSAHYNCNNIGTNLNPLIDTMFKISPSKTPLASFFYDVATSRQWFASLRGSFCHHAHTVTNLPPCCYDRDDESTGGGLLLVCRLVKIGENITRGDKQPAAKLSTYLFPCAMRCKLNAHAEEVRATKLLSRF